MKKKMVVCLVFAAFALAFIGQIAYASPKEDAMALAEQAVKYFKANGKEKTVAEIHDPKGQFWKDDLYVFIQDFNGVHVANGGNPKLVGLNHFELKDPNGVFLAKEMIQVAKTKGSGWVDYSWVNPATKKIQPKTTYVKRIEDTNYFAACGVWK
jgi:cytochrome c